LFAFFDKPYEINHNFIGNNFIDNFIGDNFIDNFIGDNFIDNFRHLLLIIEKNQIINFIELG
jgi:hypothetical protein